MPRHGSHASRHVGSLVPLQPGEVDERSPALRHICGLGEAGITKVRQQLIADLGRAGHGADLPLEPYRRYTRRAWQQRIGRRRHSLFVPVLYA